MFFISFLYISKQWVNTIKRKLREEIEADKVELKVKPDVPNI